MWHSWLLSSTLCVCFSVSSIHHPADDPALGSAFIVASSCFPPHLCIPSTSLPLKESKQRRNWRRAMVPCRREEGWLMIHPCNTVGCQCINGLSLTAIQSKLWRAGRSWLQLLMPCSRTCLVSAESKWQMSTESVTYVSHHLSLVIEPILHSPFSVLT